MAHRGRLAGCIILSAGLVSAAVTAPALAGPATHHGGTQISSVKTSLGRVVSNHTGRVMFRFLKDRRNNSRCSATCREVWPPVMSTGKARAGKHIAAAHLGRTSKGQVTYYGHPLYYYISDPKPGKTNGDGKKEFGDRWYVVSTRGKSVKPTSSGGSVTLPTGPAEVNTRMAGGTEVITDGDGGHTLYELSGDSPPSFACAGGCLTTWPPLLTKGAPTAAGDASAGMLGTVQRRIGGKQVDQVTYNGYALYRYSRDHAAGQDNGQLFYEGAGGYWYDIKPSGMFNP